MQLVFPDAPHVGTTVAMMSVTGIGVATGPQSTIERGAGREDAETES